MTDEPTPQLRQAAIDTKSGMTLHEVIGFIQLCERNDVARTARLKVRINMGGRIKSVEVGS